jgi:hypothetical protein
LASTPAGWVSALALAEDIGSIGKEPGFCENAKAAEAAKCFIWRSRK